MSAPHWVEYRETANGPWLETPLFDTKESAERWAYEALGETAADVHVHAKHDPEEIGS